MASFLQETLESLRSFDTDQLNDIDQVGSWPMVVKVIICILLAMAILAGGYFFHVADLQKALVAAKASEDSARADYRVKFSQAASLEMYRQQRIEIQSTFESVLEQLPANTEIPGLIEDINDVGIKNGLTFASIDLQPEIKHEFYIEKPIKISVMGTYHNFGAFVSDVADLSRIVTLHDFTISLATGLSGQSLHSHPSGLLNMDIIAKTYRYNDE